MAGPFDGESPADAHLGLFISAGDSFCFALRAAASICQASTTPCGLPVAKSRPSGEKAKPLNPQVGPKVEAGSTWNTRRLGMSQTATQPVESTVAAVLQSGDSTVRPGTFTGSSSDESGSYFGWISLGSDT